MTTAEVTSTGMTSRGEILFYRVIRLIVLGFAKVFWRLSVSGTENLPVTGPYVVAPVHRSNIDTPLVAMVSPRRLRFMGKDSLWKHQPWKWFLSALGGFPVHRGTADREALRRCIDVINGGEPLVIFPEGTRRDGPLVEELFDGAAYVATKTNVPIVPVGIGGSEKAMPRGSRGLRPVKIHMVVGTPMYPDVKAATGHVPRRAVAELTAQLHAELQQLFDEAQIVAG